MVRIEVERQQRARLARQRLIEVQEWIAKQEAIVAAANAAHQAEVEGRLRKAVCRMQAGGRGYLARCDARRRRQRRQSAILIQRHIRGVLGRKRVVAREELWRRVTTVTGLWLREGSLMRHVITSPLVRRALEELWRQQSVVRSMYALKEMRMRSRTLFEVR